MYYALAAGWAPDKTRFVCIPNGPELGYNCTYEAFGRAYFGAVHSRDISRVRVPWYAGFAQRRWLEHELGARVQMRHGYPGHKDG